MNFNWVSFDIKIQTWWSFPLGLLFLKLTPMILAYILKIYARYGLFGWLVHYLSTAMRFKSKETFEHKIFLVISSAALTVVT